MELLGGNVSGVLAYRRKKRRVDYFWWESSKAQVQWDGFCDSMTVEHILDSRIAEDRQTTKLDLNY